MINLSGPKENCERPTFRLVIRVVLNLATERQKHAIARAKNALTPAASALRILPRSSVVMFVVWSGIVPGMAWSKAMENEA